MEAAHLIRAARRRAGLSQRGLATAAGVARSTVTDVESGRHSPSARVLDTLLAVAGLELGAMPRAGMDADDALVAHLRLALSQRLRIALGESPVLTCPARGQRWRELAALTRRGQILLQPPLAHALWLPLGVVAQPTASVFHARTTVGSASIRLLHANGDPPAAVVPVSMTVGERVWVLPPGELAVPCAEELALRQADLLLQAYAPVDDGRRRRPAHRDPDEADEDWRMLTTKGIRNRPDPRDGRAWRLGAAASLEQHRRAQ